MQRQFFGPASKQQFFPSNKASGLAEANIHILGRRQRVSETQRYMMYVMYTLFPQVIRGNVYV